MNAFLALQFLLLTQLPPGVPLDAWALDADRVFTFQKTTADPQGNPETSVSVMSLPNPLTFKPARVVRRDGSLVRVEEGLGDVGRSALLPAIASSLRGSYVRVAAVQAGLAALGAVVAVLGVGVLAGAAFFANRGWRDVTYNPWPQVRDATHAWWLALPILGLAVGAVIFLPGTLLLLYTLRLSIRATRAAVNATPQNVGAGTDWPVQPAADVVQDHNRGTSSNGPRTPPPAAPGEPEAPVIIPS